MIRNQANEQLARKDLTDDKAATTSRQWSALRDSRVVRVSRVFGGKDRHSKVRTVKGLRDRRVRLSVPTAIQLYDLQDRLGLNQPSKVVDWLLNAAQHEIDKLPPLQFPPQDLISHFSSSVPITNDEKFGYQVHNENAATLTTSVEWNPDVLSKARERLVLREPDKSGAMENEENETHVARFSSSYRLMGSNNSLGLVSSSMPLAHGSYYHGEPWNVHETGSSQVEESPHAPLPSLLSLAPGSQLVFYPSESGFGMKESEHFLVDNLDSHSLSLSSMRHFHHSGNQG